MLLIIAIILLLVFTGLGFVVHVLWFGLLFAIIFAIMAAVTHGR